MQIVSIGDNLHEMSNPVFWEKKKSITNLSYAELAQAVIKVIESTTLVLVQVCQASKGVTLNIK